MEFEERIYQVALSFLPGIGPATAKKLVAQDGSAGEVFRQRKKHLLRLPHFGAAIAEALKNDAVFRAAEQELAFAAKRNIQVLFYLDREYPYRLKQCYDSPVVLYYEGNARLDHRRIVGIVGTRRATAYGEMLTESLVEGLAAQDVLIVSGLAYGIDILAHKAALRHNVPTIGVLAHGLDKLYPGAHRAVSRKMTQNGGLLSDFPSGTKPDKENFPKRNRVVAGLCDAVVVVESGESGGSMITVEFANNYNREVFAYPGRVNDEFSAGCHKLVKTHKAALVTSPEDVLACMNWQPSAKPPVTQKALPLRTDPDEEKLLDVLRSQGNVHYDEIVTGTGFSGGKVSALLLQLEFADMVKALPGKFYRLN